MFSLHLVRRSLAAACLATGIHADIRGQEAESPLPLKRVVMFNSGVSFVEHSGKINGNRQIEFPVNVSDINDLLKSLVVQDHDGGKVAAVQYGSPEPIARTLRSLSIDVSNNPSLSQILQQLRGQKVEVVVLGATDPLTGIVVGTEKRRSVVGRERDQVIETDLLNLRTEQGLRSVPLDSVTLTKFLDERTDRDFQRALSLLAAVRLREQKTIKLDFRGDGARVVSIAYVQEAPVWKTSYRLVLDDEQPPFLQGWAIVENMTAQDWTDVQLTLVSGRPVSFQMDLYQPLFAARPLIPPDVAGTVQPRLYDQDLAAKDDEFRAGGQPATKGTRRVTGNVGGGGIGGGGGGFGGGGLGGSAFGGLVRRPASQAGDESREKLDLSQAVESAATAEDIGESFRYVIKTPVSLRRNESAMLPIVNDKIKGEKVFVFDRDTHAKHPMVGLRLTNATDLHLQQGPITVFDGDEYAGDARIADVPPGATRLVTYALDLDSEIVATAQPAERVLKTLRIQKGGLHLKHKETRRTQFVIKNSGSRLKRLLLVHPLDAGWPTITPKPEEITRDQYRFATTAEPGKSTTVIATEERDADELIALANIDPAQVALYVNAKAASPKLREALQNLLSRRTSWANASAARAAVERSIQEAVAEETRLRDNLNAVRQTDVAYQQFLKKLTKEEEHIDTLRSRLDQARADEATKLTEWESLATNLAVE